MRIIKSQNSDAFITVGPGMLFSLGKREDGKFSIGIDNISLAKFETCEMATQAFNNLILFLIREHDKEDWRGTGMFDFDSSDYYKFIKNEKSHMSTVYSPVYKDC